jgi:Na+-transporting NADH:ubiquinone oxidoreductase subunit C
MAHERDTPGRVLAVAALVCVVCAVLVSAAVVLLRPIQDRNALLQRQRNILEVAGIYQPGASVQSQFDRVEARLVELESGRYVEGSDAIRFDIAKAARDPRQSDAVPSGSDVARINRRPRAMPVFLVRGDAGLETVILPTHGYGLWSTMYAYVALDARGEHVKGITFYSHAETPGLGAEIENTRWRDSWVGKRLIDDSGQVRFDIAKGAPAADVAEYHVDAISGATLTGNGVENMIHYWLGEAGYGPFLARLRSGGA